jgi:HK97 family phage major capsid protein
MSVKNLMETRAKLIADAGEIITKAEKENRSVSAEEKEQFDKMHNDAAELRSKIEMATKQEAIENELKEVRSSIGRETIAQPKGETRAKDLYSRFLTSGFGSMTSAEVGELRALSVGVAASGGYAAPAYAAQGFTEILRDLTPVRLAPVTVITTDGGNDIPWPVVDDTAEGGDDVGEASEIQLGDPTFSQIVFKAYNFDSKIVKVSKQFIQDNVVQFDSWINKALAERLAVITNVSLTTGNGTTAPQGIVTGASNSGITLPVTSLGADGGEVYDAIIDIIHSVGNQYRKRPSTGFMFSDSVLKELAKAKDGENRPLWVPSMVTGKPDTLLGYPIYINNDMADIGSAAKSILFGDFSQFQIRDVRGYELIRLEERYAEYRQVGFFAWTRMDSKVLNSAAIKYAVHAVS